MLHLLCKAALLPCRRNEDDEAKEEMYAFVTIPSDRSTKGKQTAIVDDAV